MRGEAPDAYTHIHTHTHTHTHTRTVETQLVRLVLGKFFGKGFAIHSGVVLTKGACKGIENIRRGTVVDREEVSKHLHACMRT